MQISIPFNEFRVPDELTDAYQSLIEALPDAYQVNPDNLVQTAQTAIITIRKSMASLRNYCENRVFQNEALEISFFKSVKPRFHAQLILWMAVYDIELNRPVGGGKCEIRFLKKKLAVLEEFFQQHKEFYHYYRSGQTDRDDIYFLRSCSLSALSADPNIVNVNPLFSTSHDYLVAAILGNDLLVEYINKTILNIKSSAARININQESSKLHWTASKSGLTELLYSLYIGGVFNNGKAKVNEIATAFQEKFDIKLTNYYHTFNEIRLRKKNRTAFMDNLRDKLSRKMDDLENL